MYLSSGSYTCDLSDLKVTILKVQFRHPNYTKVKAILSNKINGIVYETKNYKLYPDMICHWKKESFRND